MCIFLSANFAGFALAYNTLMNEPFNCCLRWHLGICYASWMNHQQQHVLVMVLLYLVSLEDSVLSFSVFAEGRMKLSLKKVGVSDLVLAGLGSLVYL